MLLRVTILFLFLGNLVFIPLYGWIVMKEMYVASLPQENIPSCQKINLERWGIWAFATLECGEIRILYPPSPWILNPHDVFKVQRFISKCRKLLDSQTLIAYVDHHEKQAFLNGFEVGNWALFIQFILLLDLFVLIAFCLLYLYSAKKKKEYFTVYRNYPSDTDVSKSYNRDYVDDI